MTKSKKTKIKLYFSHGSALFISNTVETEIHQHHLVEIFISLKNSLKIKNDDYNCEAKNFIIGADEPHQVVGNDNTYAVLLLDSESSIAGRLREKYLKDTGMFILPDPVLFCFQEDINNLFNQECAIEKAREVYNGIIRHLLGSENFEIPGIDPRIEKILGMFKQYPGEKVQVKEIAGMFDISESRLIHLFSQQVGIPIRRYLLWLRLLNAIDLIVKGDSFTYAAHESGFADSAHLRRTFKKMFGLTLLEIFKNYKNSRFVQVKTNKF